MKNLILLGATGLAGYLLWLAWKQNKAGDDDCGCGCGGKNKDTASPGIESLTAAPQVSADVQTYETSPMKTFNAPERLVVKSNWPTDGGQTYVRG